MNRFALLSLYRSLARHRLYAVLNIGGLGLGIATFLVLGLFVRFETSFEKWLPRHDGIYVMQTVWNIPQSPVNGAYIYTMGGLLEQLRDDFPGIVGTRIYGGAGAGSILHEDQATSEDVAVVDSAFFQVFDLPMVGGDGATGLDRPGDALISQSIARKYFGDADPIGRALTITTDAPARYRVTGVFRDLPRNTDLKFSVLVPMPRTTPSANWFHWGSTSLQTYLRFDSRAAARAFQARLPAFVNRRGHELADPGKTAWETQQLRLLPITRMHLEPEGQESASRKVMVVTLGLVGLLTLLIAIVNYVNLATARAGLRAREVAMRKVLGADRGAILLQFLGEALAMVAVAALVGLILAELGLPLVNAAGGLSLIIPYGLVVPALTGLVLLVGVLAGLYPALILSRFAAASVLASARAPGGGRAGARARAVLVVLQFGLAIAFMIGTAVLLAQTSHVRQTDLGFRRDGLIVLPSLAEPQIKPDQKRALLRAFTALPQIRSATIANSSVGGSGEDNAQNVVLPGVPGAGPSLRWEEVGPDFFATYGIRLIAGRLFDDAHGADDVERREAGQAANIIVNRSALPVLRLDSAQAAIGKTVGGEHPRTIIGVVDDVRFGSPRDPIVPTFYFYTRSPEALDTAFATLRFRGDPRDALAALRTVWQRMAPQVPFNAMTGDQRLAKFYEAEDRVARLFAIGAGLAVLIGCIGLWGLASFNTERRVREIGIRKTLGASSGQIVRLLVGQFLRPVLLANLIAWPLAYFATRLWLSGFADRIALSPLPFLGASLLALVIAVLTVLGQSLRASRATPAKALRHD